MGLRERKKKNTRESILAAARILFFAEGYRATSMEMIAESSDVAVGTIYNYFQSKADVMVEVNVQDTDRALSKIMIPFSSAILFCRIDLSRLSKQT